MTDVNILLKEYINYSGRANAGLMAGTTKKLRQGFIANHVCRSC